MSAHRGQRGFTLFELVVVVCIVALLATVLMGRLRQLQAAAERAAMEHVLGAVRSATALEVATQVAKGTPEVLHSLVGTNPMNRLAEPPDNYLGSLEGPDPAQIDGGHWYFDQHAGLLVYRPRHGRYFCTDLAGTPRARFKFTPVYAEAGTRGDVASGATRLRGIRVAALEPYRWLDPATQREHREP